MKSLTQALQNLKSAGFKVTPQRQSVLQVFAEAPEHFSAQEIYTKIRKKYPMMSFATVYKTLHTLSEIGEIHEVSPVAGKTWFDPNTEPHNHFICRKCGRIYDIEADLRQEPVKQKIEGHVVNTCQVYYHGLCFKCGDL